MGLVQWCILGHLYTHCQLTNEAEKTEILGLLSKLHFGILQSLLAYKSMELNQALFYMPHFVSLSQALMQLKSRGCKSEGTLHLLIEKIGQVIQVAMVTGSLKEEKGKNSNSYIYPVVLPWSINSLGFFIANSTLQKRCSILHAIKMFFQITKVTCTILKC